MKKGSLILDPTGLLPVEPEWVDPRDQRSMVIMTNVLSLWFSTSRVSFLRFQLVLPDLLLSVFVDSSGTLEESTRRARISDRVITKKSKYSVSLTARHDFWSSKNDSFYSYEGNSHRRIGFNITMLHMVDAFDHIYPLWFLRDYVYLSTDSAQWKRRSLPKK